MPILSVETIKITNKRDTQKTKQKQKQKQTNKQKKQKRTRGTKAIVKG